MASAFSLEKGKAENDGGALVVPKGAAELGLDHQRTEHYAFLEDQGQEKDKDVAKQAEEALQAAHT